MYFYQNKISFKDFEIKFLIERKCWFEKFLLKVEVRLSLSWGYDNIYSGEWKSSFVVKCGAVGKSRDTLP